MQDEPGRSRNMTQQQSKLVFTSLIIEPKTFDALRRARTPHQARRCVRQNLAVLASLIACLFATGEGGKLYVGQDGVGFLADNSPAPPIGWLSNSLVKPSSHEQLDEQPCRRCPVRLEQLCEVMIGVLPGNRAFVYVQEIHDGTNQILYMSRQASYTATPSTCPLVAAHHQSSADP
jgi:hypothetical protein